MDTFCEVSYNKFFKCHNFNLACIPFVENALLMNEYKTYNPKKLEVIEGEFFEVLYGQHLRDSVSLIISPDQIKKFMPATTLCTGYREHNLNPDIKTGVHVVDLDFKNRGFTVPFVRTFIVDLNGDNRDDSWTRMCALLDMTFDWGERHGHKNTVVIYNAGGDIDNEILGHYKKTMPLLTDDFNKVVFCKGQNGWPGLHKDSFR